MDRFVDNAHLMQIGSAIILLAGLAVLVRGLNGGQYGKQGLLRPSAGPLGRVEGWRIVVVGLTLTVLGLGGVLASRWIVFMAIGFGIVEFIEASAVLAAWHRGDEVKQTQQRRIASANR